MCCYCCVLCVREQICSDRVYYCSGTHTHTHMHLCSKIATVYLSVIVCSFDYDSPYIVALGYGRIIAGMDRGLQGTCLWERRRITMPPSLGYGESGVGVVIPPNATLVFYIRMIKIERVRQGVGLIMGAGSMRPREHVYWHVCLFIVCTSSRNHSDMYKYIHA